jgi:hypothetical protein
VKSLHVYAGALQDSAYLRFLILWEAQAYAAVGTELSGDRDEFDPDTMLPHDFFRSQGGAGRAKQGYGE